MSAWLMIIAIAAGLAAIGALWCYNPGLAILCAPLAASFITAIASVRRVKPRRARHGADIRV
jgi:hypothetical protein